MILASRLIIRICNSKRTRLNPTKKDGGKTKLTRTPTADVSKEGVYVRLKDQAGTLITAQTFKGRCLVSITLTKTSLVNRNGQQIYLLTCNEKKSLCFMLV